MPSVNKTGDIFRVQLKRGNGFPPPRGQTSHACCAAAATACRSLRRGCGANLGANHWMFWMLDHHGPRFRKMPSRSSWPDWRWDAHGGASALPRLCLGFALAFARLHGSSFSCSVATASCWTSRCCQSRDGWKIVSSRHWNHMESYGIVLLKLQLLWTWGHLKPSFFDHGLFRWVWTLLLKLLRWKPIAGRCWQASILHWSRGSQKRQGTGLKSSQKCVLA